MGFNLPASRYLLVGQLPSEWVICRPPAFWFPPGGPPFWCYSEAVIPVSECISTWGDISIPPSPKHGSTGCFSPPESISGICIIPNPWFNLWACEPPRDRDRHLCITPYGFFSRLSNLVRFLWLCATRAQGAGTHLRAIRVILSQLRL